jgi:ERCC4-type nuclease
MSRLDSAVQQFVAEHPHGWSHSDWEQLLGELSAKRVKVGDVDQLGVRLEAERLRQSLRAARVNGLGPKRVDAIVERFGSVEKLRHASPDDLAGIRTIPRRMAEELLTQLSFR